MKPTWILQNYDQEEYDKLVEALTKTDTPFRTIEYKNSLQIIDSHDLPKENECVVFYGSINFVRKMQSLSLSCVPGSYGFSHKNDCTHYYTKFPQEYLLNFPYALLTWSELKRSKDYYKQIFFNDRLFVRPNTGRKVFPGQSIFYCYWDDTIKEIEETSSVDDETLVLIANHKNIERTEYRFVIVDRKVVSSSSYSWDKKEVEGVPLEAKEMADKIASQEWQLDTAYVCDMAMTKVGPKILELNSFSSSGLYSCDRVKIVEEINKAALKDYNSIFELI